MSNHSYVVSDCIAHMSAVASEISAIAGQVESEGYFDIAEALEQIEQGLAGRCDEIRAARLSAVTQHSASAGNILPFPSAKA